MTDDLGHETPHYRICSEAEVGGIVSALNDASIAMSTAAKEKATSEELKSFFGRVVSQQERQRDAWEEALTKSKVTPQESGMSKSIADTSRRVVKEIKAEPASADWDRTASTHAFTGRLALLSILNRVLLPSTEDRGLRMALRSERAMVIDQLDEASDLQTSLGGGCAAESAKPDETAKPRDVVKS